MSAWEGAASALGSAVFCLGAAANRMIWGFICILHIQPRGELQGGISIPIQLLAAVSAAAWAPRCAQQLHPAPAVVPVAGTGGGRSLRGFLELSPPVWILEKSPRVLLQLPGCPRNGWGGIPALVPFPGMGTCQNSVDLLIWGLDH